MRAFPLPRPPPLHTLWSVTTFEEIFRTTRPSCSDGVCTSSLTGPGISAPHILHSLPIKAPCGMRSKGLRCPVWALVKAGALHSCQTAHELCQDGRPVFHGRGAVFAIKFHAHGKRIELRGGQVSLQHPFKKRTLLTAAIPEGVGFPLQLESLQAESVRSSHAQGCLE